jgi:hypothetical protein
MAQDRAARGPFRVRAVTSKNAAISLIGLSDIAAPCGYVSCFASRRMTVRALSDRRLPLWYSMPAIGRRSAHAFAHVAGRRISLNGPCLMRSIEVTRSGRSACSLRLHPLTGRYRFDGAVPMWC